MITRRPSILDLISAAAPQSLQASMILASASIIESKQSLAIGDADNDEPSILDWMKDLSAQGIVLLPLLSQISRWISS